MSTLLEVPVKTWARATQAPSPPRAPSPEVIRALEAPLVEKARRSSRLRYMPSPNFRWDARDYFVPHFVFNGPPSGGDFLRLGLFGAIHGDEPEGAWSLIALLETLLENPALATGYQLHVYPVCNPTGFAQKRRTSSSGVDLNRAFWKDSTIPEVWWLEHELITRRFHGLVSLHSDDTAEGAYAYVRGPVFSETLARPALTAAARFLPHDTRNVIDGFQARNGLVQECFEGVLSAPPSELEPTPFEIIFETPQTAPAGLQVQAGQHALLAILEAYRGFLGYQAGI